MVCNLHRSYAVLRSDQIRSSCTIGYIIYETLPQWLWLFWGYSVDTISVPCEVFSSAVQHNVIGIAASENWVAAETVHQELMA
ncbi:hypothetical protein SAY87_027418 [Trapa incisa]|uniref:Uncharacterized protein n=1 Tax=Trapa incisa TaxID=236973 RepID=A0AAN7H2C7_9MYRT|nr:hypothetical protein SAY87_027418 [Trapa incisa]